MKKSRLLSAVCASFLFITAAPAVASFVYNYTGNPYTTAKSPYDTSMSVTGTVELAAALAPNLSLTAVTPTSWSFSDGVNTTTNATATLNFNQFNFATDSAGNITEWLIQFFSFDPNALSGDLRQNTLLFQNTTSIRDQVLMEICLGDNSTECIASSISQAGVLDQPGSWGVVPIPGAVWLCSGQLIPDTLLRFFS